MGIDFYSIKWTELPELFGKDVVSVKDGVIDYGGAGFVPENEWIQEITTSIEDEFGCLITSLNRRNDAHYYYNINREEIKINCPIAIHYGFNFIIESIVQQYGYDNQEIHFTDYPTQYADYPAEYQYINQPILPYYGAFSPMEISKILKIWSLYDYLGEIESVCIKNDYMIIRDNLPLKDIKNFPKFKEYMIYWIEVLKQIHQKEGWGLLLGW